MLVFVVSSIIHVFLTYHHSDYGNVGDEYGVMHALMGFNILPGDYVIPCAGGMETMKSDTFREKVEKVPAI